MELFELIVGWFLSAASEIISVAGYWLGHNHVVVGILAAVALVQAAGWLAQRLDSTLSGFWLAVLALAGLHAPLLINVWPFRLSNVAHAVGPLYVDYVPGSAALLKVNAAPWRPLDAFGVTLRDMGKWMAIDPAARIPADRLNAVLYGPIVDAYGKVTREPILHVSIDRADLEKVRWVAINPNALLAMSRVYTAHPALLPVLKEWCVRTALQASAVCR